MEFNSSGIDKECNALEMLFQQILSDMKSSYPIWEEFNSKAIKLHTALKTTVVAVGGFLDAFQRVADLATNTKGATREIGAAITRLCMRHKSIDMKLKTFNSALVECMVTPLQDKIEEWKKAATQLDKDHTKDLKKAKAEMKKSASETFRLQKKFKKGKGQQNQLDSATEDLNEKYSNLENVGKNAVRSAMIEERSRFCFFINYLKPVVSEEISMLSEITHLTEIMKGLSAQCEEPFKLPPASEQVILDIKGSDTVRAFQHWTNYKPITRVSLTPPSSPSSIGSRKSSMCSISSITSSSSGSTKSHSPSHHYRSRSMTSTQQVPLPGGPMRLTSATSVSSQDSGFISQDTLFLQTHSPAALNRRQNSQNSLGDNTSTTSSEASTPSSPYPGPGSAQSTWTNWPENPQQKTTESQQAERPHTISSAYERTYARPPLTSQTFEPPDANGGSNAKTPTNAEMEGSSAPTTPSQYARPVLGVRRTSTSIRDSMVPDRPPLGPKPKPKAVAPPIVPGMENQALYVNMDDLMHMAIEKQHEEFQKLMPHHLPRKMSLPAQSVDLAKAIRELDAHTQALRSCDPAADWSLQMPPNSNELADAIKELEASTAALQSSYESHATSQSSLQCSSGYGTMNNTPACSEDTIPAGENTDVDFRELLESLGHDKFSTVPRNMNMSKEYRRYQCGTRRPVSTTGIPSQHSHIATLRRGSLPSKPQPPVRRSSSVSGSRGMDSSLPGSAAGSASTTPQGTPTHRRAHSMSNDMSSLYAQPGPPYPRPITPDDHVYEVPDTSHYQANNDITPTADGFGSQHASIIHDLNAKFAALTQSDDTSDDDLPLPPPPEELEALNRQLDPRRNSLMNQIKHGVTLRHAPQTNDRSAPRIVRI
ncbi:protein MTSS 1-like isoform X15 [Tubulanus polymorphus]|uniref:protein MTSS 1-like isoform X15 n=1 Tax=Tubulanus polymorphus TaxID=672921 RepID=UPI003DA444DE